MKKFGLLSVLIAMQFCVSGLLAQEKSTAPIQSYLDSLRLELNLPGISVAISKDGVTHSFASGFSDIVGDQKAKPETVYPIASVSKVFTTTLMMSLLSDGIINLDTSINEYIDYPQQHNITLRQLSNHTSGIRHYHFNEDISSYDHVDNLNDAVKIFIDDSLLFSPGAQFSYSSYGTNLIGFVLESVTNESYDKLLADKILTPLELKNTYTRIPKDEISILYDSNLDAINPVNLRYNTPGGGLYSNVLDLVRFGQAILDYELIGEELTNQAFQSAILNNESIEFGIGWKMSTSNDGTSIIYHDGHLDGAHSLLLLLPEKNISIAMLSNKGSRFGITEGLELLCANSKENCLITHEDVADDREIMMNAFVSLDNTFSDFVDWFNSGNHTEIDEIVSNSFKSEIWVDKGELIDAIKQKTHELTPFDVNISLKGYQEGDEAFVSSLRLSSQDRDEILYAEFILYNGKWIVTGINEF